MFEVAGVFAGAFVSGLLAGRVACTVEKGPRVSREGRLAFAFVGGALMAVGARLARGCTSGQALTGGAHAQRRQRGRSCYGCSPALRAGRR